MSGIGTGYDLSTTTYSPDGKVFQVDYACKAVDNGGLALGVRCKDGVVLGVEKLLAMKMLVPGANRRIAAVDRHAGMAGTGLAPDARQIVARARSECAQYLSFYGDRIPAQILADRMAHYMHLFTLYWSVRPFGASSLMAVKDEHDGYALYLLEPSGECQRYHGAAIGKGRQAAKNEIEKLDLGNLSAAEAVKHVARIVYATHDEKDKEFECELSWICDASGGEFKRVPKHVVDEAVEAAKAALESDDEMDA
jgi:20S proteasome subunit alpha 7